MKLRILALLSLVSGFLITLSFQACSNVGFNSPFFNSEKMQGGEGFDGKVYWSYGQCEEKIEVSDILIISNDFKRAHLTRENCQDQAAPKYVPMEQIRFTQADRSVLEWNGKTFDHIPPITLVQSLGVSTSGSGTSYSFTTNSTGLGHLIVIGFSIHHTGGACIESVTDNAEGGGNPYVSANAYAEDSNSGSTEIWYAVNSLGAATQVTVSLKPECADVVPAAYFAEFSGVDFTAPLEGPAAILNDQPASSQAAAAPVSVFSERALVFSVSSVHYNVTGLESGSPFQALEIAHGDGAAYAISTAPADYQAVWNQDTPGSFCSSTVVFKAAW